MGSSPITGSADDSTRNCAACRSVGQGEPGVGLSPDPRGAVDYGDPARTLQRLGHPAASRARSVTSEERAHLG